MRLPNSVAWPIIWLACIATVAADSVDSFTLINADTDADLRALTNGGTINLAVDGSNLNVRANTTPPTVGSVRFGLDANPNYRTESTPPYALAGDISGNYNPWTPSLGAHTLTATPFSGANATGSTGTPLTISFNVVSDIVPPPTGGTGVVAGVLRKWHDITVNFAGPDTSETNTPNPFTYYRLTVTFINGTQTNVVPGYYATDGHAAETSATSGNQWRVHFAPVATGTWDYVASFRAGPDVAVSTNATDGAPTSFDGATGSFVISPTDKTGRDHRGKGLLQYVGQRYLRFAETGEYFLKGGADSPEDFLAYYEFDATPTNKHHYVPHTVDFLAGDPTWQGGKGTNIVGALNYLSGKGMNSVYFLTMNVAGDGKDVWPWISSNDFYRADCSKLDQWEIVFSHMDKLGLQLHVITQETENDQLLDGGALGTARKLYYRELIARFAHHLAVVWNLGEENTNTDTQRKEFADYIRALDPYDHPIVVHTFPGSKNTVYTPLLGFPNLDGPSLQNGSLNETYSTTTNWIARSAAAGHPWFVCLDENGPANTGVKPDADDPTHDAIRQTELWGNLMAGGAGVEWYFGYSYAHSDLTCEDWRSRDAMWDQTRHALAFFQAHLPFTDMTPSNALITAVADYCFTKPGEVYAVYLPAGGTTGLDLGASTNTFTIRWYNPRTGSPLQTGTVAQVTGPGSVSIGNPPSEPTQDWTALIRRAVPLTFSIWQSEHFSPAELSDPAVSGAEADLDGDGLTNLQEYAHGRDPRLPDAAGATTTAPDNDHLTLTYARAKFVADLSYAVEATSTVESNWSTAGITEQLLDDTGSVQTIRASDGATISGNPKRFLRLRVTRF